MIKSLQILSIYLLLTVSLVLMGCSANNSNKAASSSYNEKIEAITNLSFDALVEKDSYIDPAYLEKYWVDPSEYIDTTEYDPKLDLPVDGSPNAPSDLVIESSDKYIMKLSFADNSKDETYFEITRATDPQFEKDVEIFKIDANDGEKVSFEDKIPSLESDYFYQIRAINDNGSSNPLARQAPVTWLDNGHNNGGVISLFCRSVPAVSFVTSGIGLDTATISWAPSPGGITGAISYEYTYRVHNSGAFLPLASAATNSITLNSLQPGTTYDFMVRSHCVSSTSGFAPLTFTTLSPCGVPQNLFTNQITHNSANINWDPVPGATSYNYQYKRTTNGPVTSGSTSSTNQLLSSLNTNTNYHFEVQAVCPVGNSAFSPSSFFTTINQSVCDTPTGLNTLQITSSSALMSWGSALGALSYNYQYQQTAPTPGQIISGNTSSLSQPLSGLNPGATYQYQVQSVCSTNSSNFSASANFLTDPCDIPDAALFGAIPTTNSASLSWATTNGAISYNVKYALHNGIYSTPTNTTNHMNYPLNGLLSSTQYDFEVESVCSGGTSGYSTYGIFTTQSVVTCNQPTTLFADAITPTSANLIWDSVSGATNYNVQYKKISDPNWTTMVASTNSQSITLGSTFTGYEFQVEAVCPGTTSGLTASHTFMSGGGVPQFDHIVVVIGENTNASAVYNDPSAPHITSVANTGIHFSQAIATLLPNGTALHPSQPNYLNLYAGTNSGLDNTGAIQSVTNDNYVPNKFVIPNLGRELIDVSKTYKTFSEDLPNIGSDAGTSTNNLYQRKHNPAANWMGTGANQIDGMATNFPFTSFPTSANYSSLPHVSFVVPNMCNDGHDDCITPGSPTRAHKTKEYDDWILNNLEAYRVWAETHNSLLIITYDEDDFTSTNQITTVFYGAHMQRGHYSQIIDHHAVLRFIENSMNVGTHAGDAATAADIDFCWAP